jgi:hypothetical protein
MAKKQKRFASLRSYSPILYRIKFIEGFLTTLWKPFATNLFFFQKFHSVAHPICLPLG